MVIRNLFKFSFLSLPQGAPNMLQAMCVFTKAFSFSLFAEIKLPPKITAFSFVPKFCSKESSTFHLLVSNGPEIADNKLEPLLIGDARSRYPSIPYLVFESFEDSMAFIP